jgi:hypothetical protein
VAAASPASDVLTLDEIVARFSLRDVNKGNCVVDRGRLDHLNGAHIKRALRPAAPAGAAAAAERAAALRAEVVPLLEKAIDAFGDRAKSPNRRALRERCSSERLDALLFAQHERAVVLHDFAALLLPFLCDEAEFAVLLCEMPAAAAAERVARQLFGTAAPTAEPAEPMARHPAIALAAPLRPVLEAVLRSWSAVSEGDFGGGAGLAAVKAAVASHGGGDSGGGGGSGGRIRIAPGRALMAMRVLLTGADSGCGLGDTLRLLGADVCAARVRSALAVVEGRARTGTSRRSPTYAPPSL